MTSYRYPEKPRRLENKAPSLSSQKKNLGKAGGGKIDYPITLEE